MNLYKLHSKPEELKHYDVAHELVPALVLEKFKKNPDELEKREAIIAKDPITAYKYAYDILDGPFPAGEPAIAKVASYAYAYALRVLKNRFPAGEDVIMKDPEYGRLYENNVLKIVRLGGSL